MLLVVCLCTMSSRLSAQGNYTIVIESSNGKLPSDQHFTAIDSLGAIAKVKDIVHKLRLNNHLLANLDSVHADSNQIIAFVNIGRRYSLQNIIADEEESRLVEAAGLQNLAYRKKSIDSIFVSEYLDDILTYLINNGYPFADVGFENIMVSGSDITAELTVKKGDKFTYDTLHLTEGKPISKRFLSRYLNVF